VKQSEEIDMSLITRRTMLATTTATLAMPAIARAEGTTVEFYFPVAVGGPITKIVDDLAAGFMKENPDITLKPVYAGSYTDTLTKAVTASKGGQGPQLAVLLSTDAFSLIDDELIVPFDNTAEDKAWLGKFYPAFLANTDINGRQWGVPFQRSTIVMFYNKAAYQEAGLDPEAPPANWAEHAAFAEKLTKREGDRVTRWGVQIPATGFTYWLLQAMVSEAGGTMVTDNGTKTTFTDPAVVAGLQYWVDLVNVHKAHAPGIVDWGVTPRDFLEGRAAMIWHTTGNLTNIKSNAKFPFGVAMLPADKRRGSPTGGGNFYMFKGASPAQQAASLKFLKWVTTPERAAAWGVATGYVATRPDAWETPVMKDYVAGFPAAAVARDQLQYAVPEFSTHDNQRVVTLLDDELQAALLGKKTASQALADAQAGATRVLRPYQKA
jgi:sn-glycerol 3-phosphate transport system substrate-binding protein